MKIFSRWLFKGFHAWEHRLPPAKDILLLKAMQDVYVRVDVKGQYFEYIVYPENLIKELEVHLCF